MSFTPFRKIAVSGPPPATVATSATVAGRIGGREPGSVATVASVARPPLGNTLSVDEAERAAVMEIDGGVSRAWAEWFARLDPTRPPTGASPAAWLAAIDAAGRIIDAWSAKAAALGWEPGELFGATPDAIFRLARAEIVALTPEAATLREGDTVCILSRQRTEAAA